MKLPRLILADERTQSWQSRPCARGHAHTCSKKSAASELFRAIQDVLRGKTYVTPQIARGMRQAFIRDP